MRLTAELAGQVERLYRESLEREFGKSLTFDPILVEPTENSEGEETFRVTIIYSEEGGRPNPKKTVAVLTSMMDRMEELGLPPVPIESYVPKSEYPLLLELRAGTPWQGLEE